ncbi:hypothetical protein [Escherichia coli]|uniref:hypothetical protein n=1 Tax=Escherichia coli TaxID=562 RepID=UPI0020C14707|nr:hypothetical protein [Escherichia coli]
MDVLDKFVLDLAVKIVADYCNKNRIEASLVAVVDGFVETGPNGKTYTLTLKLKVKVGDVYVLKIFRVVVFVPYIGIPYAVSFEYVEDVSI